MLPVSRTFVYLRVGGGRRLIQGIHFVFVFFRIIFIFSLLARLEFFGIVGVWWGGHFFIFGGRLEVKLGRFFVILQYVSFVDSQCGTLNGTWKNRFHSSIPLKMNGCHELGDSKWNIYYCVLLGRKQWESVSSLRPGLLNCFFVDQNVPNLYFYRTFQQQGVLGRVYPTYNWALVKLFLNNFWKYVHTLCMLKPWKKLPILINQLCHLQDGLQCFLPLLWHHVLLRFDTGQVFGSRCQSIPSIIADYNWDWRHLK